MLSVQRLSPEHQAPARKVPIGLSLHVSFNQEQLWQKPELAAPCGAWAVRSLRDPAALLPVSILCGPSVLGKRTFNHLMCNRVMGTCGG